MKNSIIYLLFLLLALLLILNISLSFYNGLKLEESNEVRRKVDYTRNKSDAIINYIVHGADLAVRGYAITKSQQLVDPLNDVLKNKESVLSELRILIREQGGDSIGFRDVEYMVNQYLDFSKKLVRLVEKDSMELFTQLLKEDRGFFVWKSHFEFNQKLQTRLEYLSTTAQKEARIAHRVNRISQILSFLLGIPVILLIIIRLKKAENKRKELLLELHRNNKEYLYNPGDESATGHIENVIHSSILNLQSAGTFVREISEGNYDVEWAGFKDSDANKNETTLAGRLIRMRDRLNEIRKDELRRKWRSEGLTSVTELVKGEFNKEITHQRLVSILASWMKAYQVWFFVTKEQDNKKYLELSACFAADGIQNTKCRIESGEGLTGSVLHNKKTMLIRNIPPQYPNLTSGLGEARPTCLLIVPVLQLGEVTAVIEIAGFTTFDDYQVNALERTAEILSILV